MAVNLSKGDRVNLTKAVTALSNVTVGLGWDMATSGASIDCDSSIFLLREQKNRGLFGSKQPSIKLVDESDVVYFGNKRHNSRCVLHHGDNLTGAGDGDDEQISVNLKDMPEDIKSVVVAINIYGCTSRHQHFGMIRNCYARIVDDATKTEICKYNLTDNYSGSTALIVGKLNRTEDGWVFEAVGEGSKAASIGELAKQYK